MGLDTAARRTVTTLLLIGLYTFSGAAAATALTFKSGPNRVALLELYTSEGCSSCPPADNWLSGFKEHPALWQQIIPVAFHVDYWNYLGWKDMFAQPDYGKRQYRYKRTGNINAVYTPGFVFNGKEWRSWFSRGDLPDTEEAAGELRVTLEEGTVKANFRGLHDMERPLQLHVTLLGFNLENRIKAGENRGKALIHNFVVLAHDQSDSDNGEWSLPLPKSGKAGTETALAVWVTTLDNQAPLQATGGWIKRAILSD